jgi:hypothetical protein
MIVKFIKMTVKRMKKKMVSAIKLGASGLVVSRTGLVISIAPRKVVVDLIETVIIYF